MKFINFISVIFSITTLAFSGIVLAEEDLPADLKENEAILKSLSQKRMVECQSAFGDTNFCQCLNKNLPLKVDFSTYVQDIIQPKEELISKTALKSKVYDEHKLINIIFATRDYCVSLS